MNGGLGLEKFAQLRDRVYFEPRKDVDKRGEVQ